MTSDAARIVRALEAEALRADRATTDNLLKLMRSGKAMTLASVRAALSAEISRGSKRSRAELAVALLPLLTQEKRQLSALIVTALPLEFRAVSDLLANRTDKMVSGIVVRSGHLCDSVVVDLIQTGPGNIPAAQAVSSTVRQLKPDVVMVVGIAGSLKSAAIGDVVVGNWVYQLDNVSDDGTRYSREKTIPCDTELVQLARRIAADEENVQVGPVVAGDVLLKSSLSTTADWIRTHKGDALAVEMESFGAGYAALGNQDRFIVVRGISDRLDDKNAVSDSTDQPLAARAAAKIGGLILEAHAVSLEN